MDVTGDPNGPPLKVGTLIADLVTGLYATQAVLAALRQRDRTCSGGRVDVAMLDAMASLLTFNAAIYFVTGKSLQPRGNVHPTISPYETFEAADGWINVGVANEKSGFSSAMSSNAPIWVTIRAFAVLRIAPPIGPRWSSFSSRSCGLDRGATGSVP